MSTRPRVVYWNNQPTPYVVDRFNAVADRNTFDFEAWFDNLREADRSWDVEPQTWRFRSRILGTTDADHPLDRIPVDLIDRTRPDVLIANYDRLHMVLGLLAARGRARRIAVRCLPTWPAWETPRALRTTAKHVLFRAVDGAKVPGPDGAAYAAAFGLPPGRSWSVTQSVDVAHYAQAMTVSPEQRERLRALFGAEGCAFAYVGRLWEGKGVFTLVDAFREVRRANPRCTLLIVGDGDDEQRLREYARGIDGVSWVGFIQPRQLPEIYAAADVLVFPTLGDPNGLVVEEAMAAGLPVVTTGAAGDIRRRVPDGEAGRVVPAGDAVALAVAMAELAGDSSLRAVFGEHAAQLAERAIPEHYAADLEEFVRSVMRVAPRPGVTSMTARAAAPAIRALVRRRPNRVGVGQRSTVVADGQ